MKSSRVDKAMMETRRSVPAQSAECNAKLGDAYSRWKAWAKIMSQYRDKQNFIGDGIWINKMFGLKHTENLNIE